MLPKATRGLLTFLRFPRFLRDKEFYQRETSKEFMYTRRNYLLWGTQKPQKGDATKRILPPAGNPMLIS